MIEAMNDIVKAGKLGKVAHVELCCYYHMRSKRTDADTTPPAGFDYDLWTGPAPLRVVRHMVTAMARRGRCRRRRWSVRRRRR